jgi:acetoacetate decarboxylase
VAEGYQGNGRVLRGIYRGEKDLRPFASRAALAELIRSGSASVEAGPAWQGDARLELFASPTEELAALEVGEIISGYYRQVGVTWDGGSVLADLS